MELSKELTMEDYTARVTTATPLQLVIINYELLLRHLKNAREADIEACKDNLKRAVDFNGLLIDSLDFNYGISKELLPLYVYVNKLLIGALAKDNIEAVKEIIAEAEKIMYGLLESWVELEKNDTSKPVIEGAEQIYAGLTYGKGMLNEIVLDDGDRGFKA